MLKNIMIVGSMAILMAGCAADGSMTRVEKGALLGGVAGAAIGSKHDSKRAAIGGAVGAAIGAGIGLYMDKQEAALRQATQGTGIQVERTSDNNIVLNMPDNITFDTAQAVIKPQAFGALGNLARTLEQFRETRITVAGHTDNVGSNAANLRLSQRRAYSVRNYLIDQGVSAQRMQAVGYGETRPVANNETANGRAKNRRVEITLQGIQQ